MRSYTWLLLSVAAATVIWWVYGRTAPKVRARIWRPSAAGFRLPELVDGTHLGDYLLARPNFGIAIAGGGPRGISMGQGAVRTLRDAGLLDKARYLVTTSGSAWFGTTLYYQTQDGLDEFLGTSLPPHELQPETLVGSAAGTAITRLAAGIFKSYPKSLQVGLTAQMSEQEQQETFNRQNAEAKWGLEKGTLERLLHCAWTKDLCSCLVDKLIPNTSLRGLWTILTGYVFLHPFGLASPDSYHCHEHDRERVQIQVGNHSTIYTAKDVSNNLPFHIAQSAILAPYSGEVKGDPLVAFPVEHTAIYSGTSRGYVGQSARPYRAIGDVLLDSFAWDSHALERVPAEPSSEVHVRSHRQQVNLGQLSFISGVITAYIADFPVAYDWAKCTVTALEKILPHAKVWSPLYTDRHGRPVSRSLPVGDAGIYDDLGHIPLLRRRVNKIVLYDSSAIHDNTTGIERENLCQMVYLRAAFGQPGCLDPKYPPGSPNKKMQRDFLTVFKPSEFDGLWSQLEAKYKAGQPVVIRGRYTVVDNLHFDIVGGWQVEIVWVIALPIRLWRSALPARTAAALPAWFPNYHASDLTTHMELSAFSQLISWVTQQYVVKELREMLKEGGTTNIAV